LKKSIAHWVLIARVLAFILMCTFGYGLLTVWLQPLVAALLNSLSAEYRPLAVLLSFCILGILAERKRHV